MSSGLGGSSRHWMISPYMCLLSWANKISYKPRPGGVCCLGLPLRLLHIPGSCPCHPGGLGAANTSSGLHHLYEHTVIEFLKWKGLGCKIRRIQKTNNSNLLEEWQREKGQMLTSKCSQNDSVLHSSAVKWEDMQPTRKKPVVFLLKPKGRPRPPDRTCQCPSDKVNQTSRHREPLLDPSTDLADLTSESGLPCGPGLVSVSLDVIKHHDHQ